MLFFVAPYGPRERKFLFEPHGRAEVKPGRDEKKVRVELTEQFIEWPERAARKRERRHAHGGCVC